MRTRGSLEELGPFGDTGPSPVPDVPRYLFEELAEDIARWGALPSWARVRRLYRDAVEDVWVRERRRRKVGPEDVFDLAEVGRALARRGVRWLLIGGQAVRLYGSPRFSRGYDAWVCPEDRASAAAALADDLGYDLEEPTEPDLPMLRAHAGDNKLDMLFPDVLRNREGQVLLFAEVYARSHAERLDEEASVRLPAIEDLIALKKMRPTVETRDLDDIRFLEVRRALVGRPPA